MTWQPLVLGESLEFLIDNRGKNPQFSASGIPAISGMSVGDGVLDLSSARRVSPEVWEKWMPHKTRRNDVVLTSEAPLGRVALIESDEPLTLAQRVFGLRGKAGVLDSRFLFYSLQTSQVQSDLQGRATGTTVLGIRQPALLKVRIPAPSYDEQCAIAEVLGALDEKIAANARLSQISINLAHAFFESTLAAAEVHRKPLRAVATTVLGGTPSRDNLSYWTDGTVPWINSGKANEDRIIRPSDYITDQALRISAAKLMPKGATLIAITGATLGQVARLEIEASGNQSLVGIWNADEHLNDWLYFAIISEIPQLLTRATGAAQQHVNKKDVDALSVPIVGAPDLARFYESVHPLLVVAVAADRENVSLADARGALLSQLMSGKLRVEDAKKVLEDVGV